MSNIALERARAATKEAECKDLAIEKAKEAAIQETKRLAMENASNNKTTDSDNTETTQDTQKISCRDRSVLEEINGTEVNNSGEEKDLNEGKNGLFKSSGFLLPKVLNKFGSKRFKDLLIGKNINITDGSTAATQQEPVQVDPITDLLVEFAESSNGVSVDENLINIKGDSIYGLGRFATFTNIKDFGGKVSNLNNFFSLEKPIIDDYVKYFHGSFYASENNNNFIFYRNFYDRKNIKVKQLAYSGTPPFNTDYNIQEDYIFGFDTYLYDSSRNVEKFKKSFLEGGEVELNLSGQFKNKFNLSPLINSSKVLTDHSFVMNLPFENNEMLEKLNLIGPSIISLIPNYNFYIEDYEKVAIKGTKTSENTLPNLYILIKASDNQNSLLSSYINLNNNISNGITFIKTPTTKFFESLKNSGNDKKSKEKAQYFENFGSYYDKMKLNSKLFSDYQNKNRNIILLSDYVRKLNTVNEKKIMFPMNIELKIPTDKGTKITKMLYDSDLIDNFMLKLFDLYNNKKYDKKEIAIAEKVIEQNISSEKTDESQDSTIKTTFNSRRKVMNTFNIRDLLTDLLENPIPNSDSDYLIIGDESKILTDSEQSTKFVNNLKRIIFEGKLNTFLKTNTRNYIEILNDKKCYNETVAFRIDKLYANSDTVIQSYWIPNNPDVDFLSIIDTQIKYSEQYTYKIYGYQFVIGNKYSQRFVVASNLGPSTEFYLRILQSADPKIIEVSLLTINAKVSDSPPLSPDVQFVPYYNNDNKITIMLNTRSGEEKLSPINILKSDLQKTSLYKKDEKGIVLYKSDDIAKRFEIMKLDKYPTSYDDFVNGFIKVVSTDINPDTKQSASAASYTDSIQANKKYYYCFRAVDIHENISNPTEIYEVEIINENGMVFPIIKTVDFKKPSFDKVTEMRRFIKIKPAAQHAFLNNELSKISQYNTSADAINSVKLGLSSVAMPWDKTFKMVVTSKKTGKKCEIKFKFKYVLE